MTLGELASREDLAGRVFRAHEKSSFAYRGIIARAETRGNLVCLFLESQARRFEGKRHGAWKPLPDAEVTFGKDTLTHNNVDGIITFTLADGGRGYFLPQGTRWEDVENASYL